MYWNNSWVNFFNKKIFFNKTLFFENIFLLLFSDKIFNFFFLKKLDNFKETTLFKKFLLTKIKNSTKQLTNNDKRFKKTIKKKVKYNFTRIWFIKYSSYILLSTFVFFYFKVKKKNNNHKLKHLPKNKQMNIFWKKNSNVKKSFIFFKNHNNF